MDNVLAKIQGEIDALIGRNDEASNKKRARLVRKEQERLLYLDGQKAFAKEAARLKTIETDRHAKAEQLAERLLVARVSSEGWLRNPDKAVEHARDLAMRFYGLVEKQPEAHFNPFA